MAGKWVLFDFFGVICSMAFKTWVNINSHHEDVFNGLMKLASLVDAGEITLTEFRRDAGLWVGMTADDVRRGIAEQIHINSGVVEFAKSIIREYELAILSNANGVFLRQVVYENDLNSIFKQVLASSDFRAVKPTPEIWERTQEQLNFTRAVLIDDTDVNVTSFRHFGQLGIIYRNVLQLERDFRVLRDSGF